MKIPSPARIRDKVKNLEELDRIVAEGESDLDALPSLAGKVERRSPPSGASTGPVLEDESISLVSLIRLALDQWLKIAVVFALMMALTVLVNATVTPIFESTAVLLVRLGRESIYRAEVGERQTVVSRDREALVNAEVKILLSGDLHEALVRQMGVEALYPDLTAVEPETDPEMTLVSSARRLKGNLIVRAKPEASVISVSFRHPEPRTATAVVSQLVDLFKEKHLEAFSDPRSTAFLEEKVAEYRQQLEEAEGSLNAYQGANVEVTDEAVRSELLAQRNRLLSALKEAGGEAAGLREKISYLERLREPETAGTMMDSRQADAVYKAEARLLELRLEGKELRGRFTETSRQVVNVREQIRLVEDFLEEQGQQIDAVLPRELVDANAERLFNEARAASLQQQLDQLDTELAGIPDKERQLRVLVRNRDTAEENYQTYVRRLETARISDEMDREKIANISVIQEAKVPSAPVRPRKTVNLLVGAFLGIALGFGLALLTSPQAMRGFAAAR
jgi:uncharacterized protein involved in exopolysaccharide biosynthesis